MTSFIRRLLSNLTVGFDFGYLLRHSIICLLVFSFYATFHPAEHGVIQARQNFAAMGRCAGAAIVFVEDHTGWDAPSWLKEPSPAEQAKADRQWRTHIREMSRLSPTDWVLLVAGSGFLLLWANRWLSSQTLGTIGLFTMAMGLLQLLKMHLGR